MYNPKLDNIKFKALKQHVRANINNDIQFKLKNTPIYSDKFSMAEFINPAVRNLSLIGGGLGAAKGMLEPRNNEVGQPISINERLGNVALNTIGGGLAGAGAGLGYSALKPSVSNAANTTANAIKNIPEVIQGNQGILDRIQDVAQSDLIPKVDSPLKKTFKTVQRRAKRDTAKTKRFFTGRGAGIETTEVPLGRTKTIIDPVTKQKTQEFIPDMDRMGNPVTRKVEQINPNAQLDEIPTAERIAASIAGGTAALPAAIPGAAVGTIGGGGIGAVLGGLAGTAVAPGAGTVAGAALGAKTGAALGGTVGSIVPSIVGGYTGASKGLQGGLDYVQQRAAQDIDTLKQVGSKAQPYVKEGVRRARDFLGFEYELYPYRKITTFAAPQYYKTGALIGTGLGAGAGAVGDISSTINRQRDREQEELEAITDIDNPYIRQGVYQEYTSPEQTNLRRLRNAGDIAARGALGLGVGAGVGLGIGGLAGHMIDKGMPVKKGLLERIYGR